GPQDGQARVDHGRELPREDRQLLELDLLLRQIDVEATALFADLERREPLLAQSLQDERLVVGNDRAADQVPPPVADLVGVGDGHGLSVTSRPGRRTFRTNRSPTSWRRLRRATIRPRRRPTISRRNRRGVRAPAG